MYIFLDESGDLGFDFENKNPSRFFIIALLICKTQSTMNSIKKIVERTLKNKIRSKKKYALANELKGASPHISAKNYFINKVVQIDDWEIYSIILDKKSIRQQKINKNILYNQLANKPIQRLELKKIQNLNLEVV